MKHPVVRAIVAVVAGTVAAFVVVATIELVSSGAFAFVLAAWTAGVFFGVWIATRLARSWVAGVVVALFFLGACVYNLLTLPHPVWFPATGIVLVLVSAAVALRLGTPARTMRAA